MTIIITYNEKRGFKEETIHANTFNYLNMWSHQMPRLEFYVNGGTVITIPIEIVHNMRVIDTKVLKNKERES